MENLHEQRFPDWGSTPHQPVRHFSEVGGHVFLNPPLYPLDHRLTLADGALEAHGYSDETPGRGEGD